MGCATSSQPSQFQDVEIEEVGGDSIDSSLVLAQRRSVDRIQNQVESEADEEVVPTVGAKEIKHKYVLKTKNNHPKVQKWIRYYSEKDRKRFQRFLNRGAPYKKVIQDLFVSNGLPPDLYYLGILESGFVIKAKSRVGATGAWQFMAPTGRQYGLKINNYVDERHDIIRSTLAAIRYLKELYRQKKTWHMALAAYNAGPGRVRRAMRRGRSTNYWNLTRRRLLPYDTREYIPQFLAILSIGKNLGKYDFTETIEDPLVAMELVKVPSPVHLKKISELTQTSLSDLKKLNPHLKRDMTPPTKKKVYHLWVKKELASNVSQSFALIQNFRIKGLKVKRSIARYRGKKSTHRVRRGQNLSTIARRYGMSVSKIKRYNNLKSSRIYVGQKLRVRSRATSRNVSTHRVRRGQNLSSIARRYGMSVSRLKKLNRMKSSRIIVGQKLKVKGRVASKSTRRVAKTSHKVRSGENLSRIAKKYGTSVASIKRLNKLKNGKIFKGQKLRILKSKTARAKKYKIRRGDNLYKIAKRFGITIKKIKRLNKLKNNQIMRGHYLIVAGN